MVIPIMQFTRRGVVVKLKGGEKRRMTRIPVDLAYSCTFYKVQGATLDRIILSLGRRPGMMKQLELQGLMVGLSRVRHSKYVRLLPHAHSRLGVREEEVQTLHVDEDLKRYMAMHTPVEAGSSITLATLPPPPPPLPGSAQPSNSVGLMTGV